MGLGILGLIWYRMIGQCGLRCNHRPLHTDAVINDQQLMANKTRLQVEPDEEGVELETMKSDVIADSSTPTGFVPRGRLAAD